MVRLVGEVRPSGYELDDQTLSLDDSIALTVRRPLKSAPKDGVLDASWALTPMLCSKLPMSYNRLVE